MTFYFCSVNLKSDVRFAVASSEAICVLLAFFAQPLESVQSRPELPRTGGRAAEPDAATRLSHRSATHKGHRCPNKPAHVLWRRQIVSLLLRKERDVFAQTDTCKTSPLYREVL